jgi:hypothetical protein
LHTTSCSDHSFACSGDICGMDTRLKMHCPSICGWSVRAQLGAAQRSSKFRRRVTQAGIWALLVNKHIEDSWQAN